MNHSRLLVVLAVAAVGPVGFGACGSSADGTAGAASGGTGGTGARDGSSGTAGSAGSNPWGGSGGGSGSGAVGGSAGAGGGPPLDCDAAFSFTPTTLGTGSWVQVGFTDPAPLTYVDLTADGPGMATVLSGSITSSDPWTWTWNVSLPVPGVWTFRFSAGDPQLQLGTCQKRVTDTGPPPPPPDGGTGGSGGGGTCSGKVCGDDDGNGGKCETCPMVGACLDPPSPIGPGGNAPWACLDNAGCLSDSGLCKIWCPFEPCDTDKHPQGCPNNTEACFVPAGIASYEDACKQCCESAPRNSCWDDAVNVCRYPGECGLPLPGQ